MNRLDLCRRLVAAIGQEDAVIGGIGNTNFDLWAAGHRPRNFYMLGSMGLACPIALGLALAQPRRGVIALEGDGSLLMALGCLATVGMLAPANLTLVVFDNRMYEITGRQPTATGSAADIVAIAQGAGLASAWVRDAAHFDALLGQPTASGGPRLYAAAVDESRAEVQTPRDPVLIRQRFMQGLGTGRRSPLDD